MNSICGHWLHSTPSPECGTARDLAAHVALQAVKDARRGSEDARHWLAHGGFGVLDGLGLDRAELLAALAEQDITL